MLLSDIGRKAALSLRGVTDFAVDHKKAIIGTAAAGAIIAARPVRHISKQIGTSFEGDPNYLRKIATGGFLSGTGLGQYAPGVFGSQPGFGANILTTGNTPGITSEGSQGLSVNPDPDQALRMAEQTPGTNPSGALVFGLYSNRLQ